MPKHYLIEHICILNVQIFKHTDFEIFDKSHFPLHSCSNIIRTRATSFQKPFYYYVTSDLTEKTIFCPNIMRYMSWLNPPHHHTIYDGGCYLQIAIGNKSHPTKDSLDQSAKSMWALDKTWCKDWLDPYSSCWKVRIGPFPFYPLQPTTTAGLLQTEHWRGVAMTSVHSPSYSAGLWEACYWVSVDFCPKP